MKKLKRFCALTIAIAFLLNSIPYPAYAMRMLHTGTNLGEGNIRDDRRNDEVTKIIENLAEKVNPVDVQDNPLSPFELQLEVMGVNPSDMNDERFREAIRKEFKEFAADIDELLAFENKWDWFKAGNYQNDLSSDIAGNNIANDLAYKFAKEKLEEKIEKTIAENVLKGDAELLICYLLREAYEKYNRGERELIDMFNAVESVKGGFVHTIEPFEYLEENKIDGETVAQIKDFFNGVFGIYFRLSDIKDEREKRAFLYTHLIKEMGFEWEEEDLQQVQQMREINKWLRNLNASPTICGIFNLEMRVYLAKQLASVKIEHDNAEVIKEILRDVRLLNPLHKYLELKDPECNTVEEIKELARQIHAMQGFIAAPYPDTNVASVTAIVPVKTYGEFKKTVCEVLGWHKDKNITKIAVSILNEAAKGEKGEADKWIDYLFYQAQVIDGNDKIALRIIDRVKLEMNNGNFGKNITDEREKENIENTMIKDLVDQAAKSSEQYLDAAISVSPLFDLSQPQLRNILSKEDNPPFTMFITASSFFTAETMSDVNKIARPLVREELAKLAVALKAVGKKLYIVATDGSVETVSKTRELLGLDDIALLESIEVVTPISAYYHHSNLIGNLVEDFKRKNIAIEKLPKLLGKKSFILLDTEFKEELDGYQSVNKWWDHVGMPILSLDRVWGFKNTVDNPIMSILFAFAKSSDRLKEFADLVNEFPIEDADKKASDVRKGFFYGAFQYSPEEFEKRQEAIEECQRFVEML